MATFKVLIVLLALFFQSCISTIFYVDQKHLQSKNGIGSWRRPFKTIKDCIEVLENPGDECQIRAGSYHESINIEGLHGTPQQPIVIRGYADERPTLDGTVEIKNQTEWIKIKDNIYKAKISSTIWQLFLDGEMMTNARWPNAKWSDKSIFNGKLWARLARGSKQGGTIVDKGGRLKSTGLNMTGAVAILNIGSFTTFVAIVENHTANSDRFDFKDTFGGYNFKIDRSQYFLEDKLELLDAPEEWYFDVKSKDLYIWTPNGNSPYGSNLRGKAQSYVFQLRDCHHVTIKNLDLFATAIKAKTTGENDRVTGIRFDSLNFRYHTYSKRMLGKIGLPDWLNIDGFYTGRGRKVGNFTFYNNTFYGSDGLALAYAGNNVRIENNLFEYNDWTGANMLKAQGGLATIKSFGWNNLFFAKYIEV